MITIREIQWDNWFSYGEKNKLTLTDSKVTQITGKNGTGKTSIPIILGEVFYGKNAVGKVKNQLFNRYIDKPTINAVIIFNKDEKEYKIVYNRKSTLKLVIYEDDIDISSHSSTNTLKTITDILGFDFKLFWQLIYQSSNSGLEFLTATDTNRKKFLINLFNLDKYLVIHEQFKKINSDINNELLVLKGKHITVKSWIDKHSNIDLTDMDIHPVPVVLKEDIDLLAELKSDLNNIDETNKKINTNNQLKTLLSSIDTTVLNENIILPNISGLEQKLKELNKEITENNTHIRINNEKINKIKQLDTKCPTCTQEVQKNFKHDYINTKEKYNALLQVKNESIKTQIDDINNKLSEYNIIKNKLVKKEKISQDLQDLLSKIDNSLQNTIIDKQELIQKISDQEEKINSINKSIKIIAQRNSIAEAHNSKIKVIKEQLTEYLEQLNFLNKEVQDKENILNNISVIKKAFSTNGLLNYKIDYLIKDLEHQINTYLEDLSNGRFQLIFTLNGEKLDIEIIDDSKIIGIEELSAGELARINTSTLLAIRKLMAAISSTKLNILFLDEIMGVLDDEGKEKLIEILNRETELNTFLVSHEFTHPLIPTVNIVKENKISRIENG